MSDPRKVKIFERNVSALERRYTREVLMALRDHRAELVNIVSYSGVNNPTLIPAITSSVNQLGRNVVQISKVYQPLIVNVSQETAAAQLALLANYVPNTPDIETAALAAEVLISRATSGLQSTPGWVTAYQSSLITEIALLRAAQEAEATVLMRLFAETLTDRASVYRKIKIAAAVQSDALVWAAAIGSIGGYFTGAEQITGGTYQKQAIAAIDERTTDCCLRVHGQIQPLDAPFILTGYPRFADRINYPPFHWRCRTATTLYHPAFEELGIGTPELRSAANAEIDARTTTGKREEIHPAHSTSRRGVSEE